MSVSRRSFLSLGASFGGALALGGLAGCAGSAPRATVLAPGVTRVALGGATTATTFSDGFFSRPLDANFVKNAPLAAVQQALRIEADATGDASAPTAAGWPAALGSGMRSGTHTRACSA